VLGPVIDYLVLGLGLGTQVPYSILLITLTAALVRYRPAVRPIIIGHGLGAYRGLLSGT